MMSLMEQVESGRLVCPLTHGRLDLVDESLVTADGQHCYPLRGGVPFLLPEMAGATSSPGLPPAATEAPRWPGAFRSLLLRLSELGGDFRTAASRKAFSAVMDGCHRGGLLISVGGGPTRAHPRLVNLNIAPLSNVEIVADAHRLPYGEGGVDGIHCEAVLEHLREPEQAVREMFRVLIPGGRVYAATPFLQAFHGYPSHYQNFTTVGHASLFERAGFVVEEVGVCVGPMFAICDLLTQVVRHLLPGGRLGAGLARLAQILLLPVRSLDHFVNTSNTAHILASTTFVLARKPE